MSAFVHRSDYLIFVAALCKQDPDVLSISRVSASESSRASGLLISVGQRI